MWYQIPIWIELYPKSGITGREGHGLWSKERVNVFLYKYVDDEIRRGGLETSDAAVGYALERDRA